MDLMPLWFQLTVWFCLGAIIGSFASVIVCRMHTGASMNARSHCLSCGRTLSWFDLIPVVSFLAYRGRCRTCAAKIPRRDFVMETSLGVAFMGIAYANPDPLLALLLAALVTMLAIGAAYDLQHLIIPDEVVVGSFVVGAGILVYHVMKGAPLTGTAVDAAFGGIVSACFFGALWLVSRGKWMGLGDAKLALPLGMLTGLMGAFSMIVLSFWIGALITVLWMGVRRLFGGGQSALRFHGAPITMKSEVPFAPYLLIAFALVYFFHVDVLTLTSYVSQLLVS